MNSEKNKNTKFLDKIINIAKLLFNIGVMFILMYAMRVLIEISFIK
ncbi:hypothetical protein N134_04030 [Limosilactobacillus reuteri TD1]|uniref:Uncharacterized protein n=1 Tax=Limosilactobacillus reuteri TD1 TaxID=1358027 RepID=S5NDN6_LIMRT|nr:hypothetical protein [Limosilactobacillus reuteri]AGR65103.1 hypothetical protein N134_04030 [Limosilactobacillus reuteri TD1]